MSLYILRHQKRFDSLSTNTSLTEEGLLLSKTKTLQELEKENIKIIYSSPFLRTLQTISPYARKKKITINIENGFMERLDKDFFKKGDKLYSNYNIRKKYDIYKINKNDSILSQNFMENRINENVPDIEERLTHFAPLFMEKIKPFLDKGKNVVIVTHGAVVKNLLRFLNVWFPFKNIEMGTLFKINKITLKKYYNSELS
jgi:broad specificity phosphatase PhoE